MGAVQAKPEKGTSAAKPKNGQQTPAGDGAAAAAAMEEDEDDDEEDDEVRDAGTLSCPLLTFTHGAEPQHNSVY